MTNSDYAIETMGLIKRYPTASRREEGGYGRGFGSSVSSFGNIFGVLKRKKGSYIKALRGIDLQVKKGEV